MDPKYILVLAVILVVGWFAVGVIYNLRRGEALLRWMRGGLPLIGERTTLRWLGTSVAELVIAHPRRPFRRLETLLVLAPRDLPWFWLLAALQGRRDTLILRAHLATPPGVDFELADPSHWTGRQALRLAAGQGWESRPYRELQLMAPPGKLDQAEQALAGLETYLHPLTSRFWRLSLRRETPHLELHLPFIDPKAVDAHQWFNALQDLATAAPAPAKHTSEA